MASRYDSVGQGNFWGGTSVQETGPSSSSQDSSQTTNSSSTSNSSTSGSKSGTTSTQNMDPSSLAALQALIAQLLGGGTEQMAQEQARRLQEIQAVQAIRGDYSKGAAFADAQGAMNQFLRQAMEQAMPSLVRAAEGAGTSANSMRALLTQDTLTRAAEGAAALGLKAATDYGSLGANYSSVLEQLTRPDNSQVNALLGALNIAKGAMQETEYSEQSSSSTSGSQSGTSTQTGSQNTANSGNTVTTTRGPAQTFDAPSAGGSLGGYSVTPGGMAGLSNAEWNALAKASGGGLNWFQDDSWSNYTNF